MLYFLEKSVRPSNEDILFMAYFLDVKVLLAD